jgi:DeoR family fructose operon transcriptional repressor
MLDSIHADVAVLGIGGITAVGLTDSNTLIMGTVKKMIKRARKVIVVADATKFGRNGMVRIASLDEIDVLVSDDSLSPEHQGLIAHHSVELLLA